MKKVRTNARNLLALLRRLKSRRRPEDPPHRDPVSQLVISFLQWETTRRQADRAFEKVMATMVDINELRVSFGPEVINIIGSDYPLAAPRVMRMREALNEIYLRERDVIMRSLVGKAKKEQRAYVESLPGVMPYVASQVVLLSFGGHAMPTDNKLVALLAQEKVVDPTMAPAEVEPFLLRHVKADDGLNVHLRLQAWSDSSRRPAVAAITAPMAVGTVKTTANPTRAKTTKQTQRRAPKKKPTR